MNGKNEHIESLVKLGLTALQSRIYLAVLTLQKANVGKISTIAEVARPDVYRVLPKLEKVGLVRKVISAPVTYEATPLKEGCQILLEQKKLEYEEAELRSLELIKEFDEKNQIKLDETGVNFFIVNSKQLLLEKFKLEDSNTKKTLDIIGRWGLLRSLIFNHTEVYEQAIKRGVRIRFIIDKQVSNEKSIQKLCNNEALFQVRYIEPLPVRCAIYDSKSANMCVRNPQDQQLTPSLWTNNSEFVKLLTIYFENLWQQAERAL